MTSKSKVRLTRRKALEICRDLWRWLEKTGSPFGAKEKWPGWEKYGRMEVDCPCCEYTSRLRLQSMEKYAKTIADYCDKLLRGDPQ